MARGVRKSPVEKLQGELADVQASIAQYESCLETMREKERYLWNISSWRNLRWSAIC